MKRIRRATTGVLAIVAVLATSLALVGLSANEAEARGPAYPGPQTTADGPAYFGPAPNPLPYCENPTYFDPWAENVTPTGRLDVGDTAMVTTDGMTMVLEIEGEGDPGGQYPGFFPFGGEGTDNDRAKGFEVASGDSASITLSQPLFYAQFVFTDVDQPGEGFEVIPDWAVVGEVVAYGGDGQFTFDGTTNQRIVLDDLDGTAHPSESVNGRVQLDMLGAVNGISFQRPATRVDPDTGQVVATQGQSGLSVAGGCEASGAAKTVVAGPTWNGDSFEVTYELRFRNNMPAEATILEVVQAAQAKVQSTFSTAPPSSIPLTDLRLQDQLADPAFSAVTVTNVTTSTPNLVLNQGYDGLGDDELLDAGSFLEAEKEALISLTVEYTPDTARVEWVDCATGYDYLNQTEVSGTVGGIAVSDLSDDGIDPSPSSENGSGGVDDPTPVLFPCLPAGLDIVKTVVDGPNGTCPTFANGVPGEGPALPVLVDDVVTYCISVRNADVGTANNVVVVDPQAPTNYDIGTLARGQSATMSYDIQVGLTTPTLNTATTTGTSALGDLGPESDTAAIIVSPTPQPALEIVKTAMRGANASCPDFVSGTPDRGDAVQLVETETVTYCISVRNVGQGDATNVVITDDQAPNSFDLNVGALAVGAEATRSFELEVSVQTEPVNIAFADGDGPYGPVGQVADEALIAVSLQPDPVLEIVKTVLEGPGATCPSFADGIAGDGPPLAVLYDDVVTYCLSITNRGANDANSVQVSDPQAPGVFSIGGLAIGQEVTRSYDVVVTAQTPQQNTAIVTGVGPNGQLRDAMDTALIDPSPQPDPVLEIVKTVVFGPDGDCPGFDDGIAGAGDALPVDLGDTVTYCISIRNTGLRDAVDVVINDEQAPGPFEIGTLATAQTVDRSYDLLVDVGTPLVNIAVVTGDGPNGELPEDHDDARIDTADIELVHTVIRTDRDCDDTVRDVDVLVVDLEGLDVRWCYRMINTGNVPLTNLLLSSPTIGFADLDVLANAGASYVVRHSGGLELIDSAAALSTGDVVIGSANAEPGDVVLLPGETVTIDVSTLIPGGGLQSTADVIADPADVDGNLLGLDPVTDMDEAEVREGLIQLDKTVAAGADANCAIATELVVLPIGAPATWCFTVTNVGTLDLGLTEIIDETLGVTVAVPENFRVLVPEASFTVSASGDSPGAIINLASVEGHALDDAGIVIDQAPVVRDEDTAEIRLPQADLAIDKMVSNRGPVPIGTVLTYTLQVTNSGPHAASGVEVADVLPAGLEYVTLPNTPDWACSLEGDQEFRCLKGADMATGESATLFYTVRVAANAARGVTLENVATVDAITHDPDETNNTDRETMRTDVATKEDPTDPLPEYPGPFTVSDPPPDPSPELPDEVLGLAITGSSSRQLGLLSGLMMALGALMMVGARRSRSNEVD